MARSTKHVAILVGAISFSIACVVACGSFGQSGDEGGGGDSSAPDATAPDAASSIDAGGAPPLRPPPRCPLGACSSEYLDAGYRCYDDNCTEGNVDFPNTGAVTRDGGTCQAKAPSDAEVSSHVLVPRTSARHHVTVSFRWISHTAPISNRAIAALSDDRPGGPRVEIRSVNGGLVLCESAGSATGACTSTPVLPESNDTVEIYGVASTEVPPVASYALRVGCKAPQVLAATLPFGPESIRASVGCLMPSSGEACELVYDNLVLLVGPE